MLYDIISPALASVDSTAAIWFDDRLLLTSADSVFDLDIWEDARAYLSNNPNTTLFHVDDSDCIVLSYESPASYLRCMTITPNADYVRLSQRSSQRLLLLLVIVIVCCGVLIAFLITRQYRPISSLMTMATSISPKNPHTRLENVYDTFSELVTINQHLESRNKEYTENRLIYSLLRGVSIDDPQQKGMLLSFEGSFYITLLVSTPRLNDRSPLLDRIREIFRDHFRVMVYLPAISDDVIVLLSYRNNDEESFRNAIKQIHENLTRTLKTDITFGVGNPVENISDIPQSYSDAAYALESILIKGKGSVVYINDLDDQDDYHRLFPYREADILHSYILSGDTAEAAKILQNILDFIRNSRFYMTVAHRICADIYNRTLRTLEYSYTDNEAVVPSIPQFGRLSDYSSSEELVDAMTRLFDGLLQSLSNKKKQSEQTRGESMRDYIRNNCLSMDFSLQHMADDFGMAMTNLCHYYRSAFNQTILDYATEYRIEKACMLLQESNLSIVEISERVGYATPSGFIRRFKQVKGITPGKYNQSISKYAPNEE